MFNKKQYMNNRIIEIFDTPYFQNIINSAEYANILNDEEIMNYIRNFNISDIHSMSLGEINDLANNITSSQNVLSNAIRRLLENNPDTRLTTNVEHIENTSIVSSENEEDQTEINSYVHIDDICDSDDDTEFINDSQLSENDDDCYDYMINFENNPESYFRCNDVYNSPIILSGLDYCKFKNITTEEELNDANINICKFGLKMFEHNVKFLVYVSKYYDKIRKFEEVTTERIFNTTNIENIYWIKYDTPCVRIKLTGCKQTKELGLINKGSTLLGIIILENYTEYTKHMDKSIVVSIEDKIFKLLPGAEMMFTYYTPFLQTSILSEKMF